MDEPDDSLAIHDRIERHTPQFEQVYLLLVNFRDLLVRIGQAREGKMVLLPVGSKFLQIIRTDRENFRIS